MTIAWRLCVHIGNAVYVGNSLAELQAVLDALGYSGPALPMLNRNGLRVGWVR